IAAAQGTEITIDNVMPEHLESLFSKLREMGVEIEQKDEQITIRPTETLSAVKIKTLVHPGFPTDLQQPFTSLLTKTEGTSIVTDTIYQARFKPIDELRRMNATIKVEGNSAVVTGPVQLEGAQVKATDLRAGAALIVAGLMAEGKTEITGIDHIERGYENITEKLRSLGANIHKIKMTETDMQRTNVK